MLRSRQEPLILQILMMVIYSTILLLMISVSATATMWVVDDDLGSWADFNSIGDAIDVADNNDTIRIFSGQYKEDNIINTSLHFIGNGTTNTFIVGIGNQMILTINGVEVTMESMSVQKGGAKYWQRPTILIKNSTKVSINSCEILNSNFTGLRIINSSNVNLSLSSIHSNGNRYSNDGNGASLSGCSNISINNCTFTENGDAALYLENCSNVYINSSDFSFSRWGILSYWPNSNITIDNCSAYLNEEDGILLRGRDSIISQCNIYNNSHHGARLELVNSQFINNNIRNSQNNGLALSSENVLVADNTIKNHHSGINLWECTNISVKNNTILNDRDYIRGYYGFRVQSSSDISLISNRISNFISYGIQLSFGSSNISIGENIIVNSNRSGIYLDSYIYQEHRIYHIEIHDNTISNSSEYGIKINGYSYNCEVINNAFINNSIQAFCNGTAIVWNNSNIGNYWSDHSNIDSNRDGIADEPYYILGNSSAIDYYPLIEPFGRRPITWIVDDDEGAWVDFHSIQDAINCSIDWDTILVYDGIYYENIIVNRTLEIIGNGSVSTLINGQGRGDVVRIVAEYCIFNGFHVSNSSNAPESTGIGVFGVADCLIERNNCSENLIGIYDFETENCTYWKNSISECQWGIHSRLSYRTTIVDNNCSFNDWYGIYVHDTEDLMARDNVCDYNYYGFLDSGTGSWIKNTQCSYNYYCGLSGGMRSELIENECSYNPLGIIVTGDHSIIEGNTIKSNEAGVSFFNPRNITLRDNKFTGCGINIAGDSLDHWNSHNISTSNTVNGNPVYYYANTSSITVPSDAGQVIIANCSDMTSNGLTFSNTTKAIDLAYTNDSIISSVSVSGNSVGIELVGSHDNKIVNCEFIDCVDGVLINTNSTDNIIEYNEFVDNKYGVYMYGSEKATEYNQIRWNSFTDSTKYAIMIRQGCQFNYIHHNTITGGNGTLPLAHDENSFNIWDDNVSEGNWWSNYDGQDVNLDGIGEEPYIINSSNNVTDRYPFTGNQGVLTMTLRVNANPTIEDSSLLIFVLIEQSYYWNNGKITVLINDEEVDNVTMNLNGSISLQFSTDLRNEGEFTIRAVVESGTTIERKIDVTVIKRKSNGATGIPDYGIILLSLTTIIFVNLRKHE